MIVVAGSEEAKTAREREDTTTLLCFELFLSMNR